MKHFILEYLNKNFDEIKPLEFYRSIFPIGELEEKEERTQGKYNAIAVELFQKDAEKTEVKRYIINNDLKVIETLLKSNNFVIISPISYCGKSRESKNARFIYAIAIDLDGITEEKYLIDLFHQMKNKRLPIPTYTVFSGSGLHLYYQLTEPIPCFKNIISPIIELKNALTKRIWNSYTTKLYDSPQIESLFQGFRLVGGVAKDGKTRTKAFITGNKVDIEYLNSFVNIENIKPKTAKKGVNLSLSEAAKKYPDWYERRIIQQQKKGTWTCKRDLFEWWKRKINAEAKEGHRYYCVMCLAIYAKKSGIEREELEEYAFSLVKQLDELTTVESNKFTKQDIMSALEMYNDNFITFPIDSITKLTDITIQKNKRNGRTRSEHIKYMNMIRKFKIDMGEITLKRKDLTTGGRYRPTKEKIVREWQEQNPQGTQYRCSKETGLDKKTVRKWWSNSN